MIKLTRAGQWWSVIIPQILGWVYFCELQSEKSFLLTDYKNVLLFFTGVVFIAAFGYLFNDYCDMASDRLSGKSNMISRVNPTFRIVLIAGTLIIGAFSWAMVEAGTAARILYALQVLALFLYSMPLTRWKAKGMPGVVTDAFYGHINPALFTLLTFTSFSEIRCPGGILFLALVLLCTALKGVRNILLHQIEDRKKDAVAGINTYAVQQGGLHSLSLVNFLLPIEILSTVLLVIAISVQWPPFFLSAFLFALMTYLKFSGWKLPYLPKRQLKFKFLHFMNDYYEVWIPVFLLLLLAIKKHELGFLIVAHFILFPEFITKLAADFRTIRENFKTEEEY